MVQRHFIALVAVMTAGCPQGGTKPPPDPVDPVPVPAPDPVEPAQPDPEPAPEPTAGPMPSGTGKVVVGTDPCKSDADCVRATCCHAAACVNKSHAPNCSAVSCTMSCEGGTTDCGGGCLCQDGKCAAQLVP